MDILSSNSLLMMQRSMEFLWSKQACILDNIANVETPNYKAKYATFEEALRSAILTSAEDGVSTAAIREAIRDTPVVIQEAQESTRLDDNGVNITEQSIELSRTGYQLQYVIDAIANDVSTIRAVIRG
ncbi:flagellar biosynthesis protein FlgB [uncultured Intestinimonas sp.]|uniref:flagellar basal body rod protein FlgB n=1 Tax=uncultured Intestinimonas sp. TaxID=1689265 RepID=UPI0025CD3ADC|nr:flagellar biosynthesis protein FlgB [uncultured Intestinimonas sp.]